MIAVAEPAPNLEDERKRIRRGLLYCLGVFAAVRVGLSLLALAGVALLPHSIDPVSVPGWRAPPFGSGSEIAVTAWERFDALWFLRIAAGGYAQDGSAAFFPLYPLAIRGVSFVLGGHPLAAALLVSNLSFLGALVGLYFLTTSELSEAAARKAVAYTAVFPTAFFFLAPYSESTFFLMVVLAFWGARRGRWAVAGVTGALASATRSVGIFLVPALAVEALDQWRRRESASSLWRTAAWSLLPAAGTFAYLAYWKASAGDWLAPIHQQATWQRQGEFPWVTLYQGTKDAFLYLGNPCCGYHLLDWLIVIPALGLAGYALMRFRPAFAVYTWAGIIAPLSMIFPGRPLMSMPRFLLVLFPLTWALAALSERGRIPHGLVLGASAAGLGLLTVLFVNWYYIF